MVWATSTIDRRKLLAASLLAIAVGQGVSALAQDYWSLLATRIVMLTLSAVFTPVAASTISLIVPEQKRASAISFVFLGWSLAVAVGLPIVTFIAAHVGWRETFATLSVASFAAGAVLLAVGASLVFYGLLTLLERAAYARFG